MKKEIFEFIKENGLNPFHQGKSNIKSSEEQIYITKDAREVNKKVMTKLSSKFIFKETSNLWNLFSFTQNFEEIKKRQEFFKHLKQDKKDFLKELNIPRKNWKPRYDILAVTEDENTFINLNKIGVTSQLLISDNDLSDLDRYDIVQVIECENFKRNLESLPQTIFIDTIDNIYLERYLEILSGWRENFNILRKNNVSEEIHKILEEIEPLFNLLDNKEGEIITESKVESILEEINQKISVGIKDLTISGEGLIKILGEGKIPKEILEIVQNSIEESGVSEHLFNLQIPVTIDYKELEDQIKKESANEFTNLAQKVKKHSEELKNIPKILEDLSAHLLIEDFCSGIIQFLQGEIKFPENSNLFLMEDSKNLFLEDAKPISFLLDEKNKCSILTGANSGGKTTLLEHIIQNITLFNLGLPITGYNKLPIFNQVYYFAKNKGSASKGAFETLLSQMANITPGGKTLILADEIEAVTEPGIAGLIISATCEFFINKNCFLVIATHLGHEIQKTLPPGARIDGIEAKGLDENFNLIVDHNPVLGRLAHSTPELIVERMANSNKEAYFKFLYEKIKK